MDEAVAEEQIRINEINSKLETAWDGTVAKKFARGTGEVDDPYIIENASQLAYFAAVVNGKVESENLPTGLTDITFAGKYVSIVNSINLGNREFTPIGYGGNSATDSNADVFTKGTIFQGTLDGKNNVITGLKIGNEDMQQRQGVGLVGVLGEFGTVKNVVVYDGVIKAAWAVGGIVGASKGTIENCRNDVNVTAVKSNTDSGTNVGGIVGYTSELARITNCTNNGIIKSDTSTAGGIVGWMYSGESISGCKNYGTIIANETRAGGVVGSIKTGNITNCNNSGTITAHNQQAGGMVGTMENGSITNCENSGEVKTEVSNLAGGMVGLQKGGNITGCSNSGTITAHSQSSGGMVGKMENGSITNCENSGEVKTEVSHFAGGMVGWQIGGSVTGCSNSGTITSISQMAGGITGRADAGSVSNCYNKGNIESKSDGIRGISGGIVGGLNGANLNDVFNSGTVKVGNYNGNSNATKNVDTVGGIVGLQTKKTIVNAYNKGEVILPANAEAQDVKGGVVGQKTGGSVTNTYYYGLADSTLLGIGTGSTTDDKASLTQNIWNTLNEFINWCKSNSKYVNVE